MLDHRSDKIALRKNAIAHRRALGQDWRRTASEQIHQRLLKRPEIQRARTISVYASFGHEVHTHGLINEFLSQHKQVVLPCVIHRPHFLELRLVDRFPDGCRPKDFGILEPDPLTHPEVLDIEEVDVVLTPGLLFTRQGYRLVYGGGYYDQLLVCRPRLRTIGLAFSSQLVPNLPLDPWDRSLDAICTESEWIDIRKDF
jgi:5-formyltetrahydrofolate cyclo-ligase